MKMLSAGYQAAKEVPCTSTQPNVWLAGWQGAGLSSSHPAALFITTQQQWGASSSRHEWHSCSIFQREWQGQQHIRISALFQH